MRHHHHDEHHHDEHHHDDRHHHDRQDHDDHHHGLHDRMHRRLQRRAHRDHGGHGRRRARRGAVGSAVLALLDEQPMHGYELITALEEKSGGRWKPSAGSIYPALRRLEHRGFIASTDDDDGKRRFELTDAGRERVEEQRAAGNDTPWDDHGLGHHGELRRAMAELVGPARQIGRFGTPEQSTAAVTVVKDATAALYRILADRPSSDESDTEPADGDVESADAVGDDGDD